MAILVTGGAGFIGSHTCVELLNAGEDIVVMDNFYNSNSRALDGIRKITGKDFKFYEDDMLDIAAVDQIFAEKDIEQVIHFAGYKCVPESVQKPLMYYSNNLRGTFNILETMKKYGCTKFVFSSSATVYGIPATVPVKEDFPLSAIMPIVLDKATGKRDVLAVAGNDYPTPDGTCVRDYIHVVDLAKGHVAAVRKARQITGVPAYNLGTGHGYSVLDILNTFQRVNNIDLGYTIGPRRPGDAATTYADPSLAEKELGWKAEKTLDEMCRDAWNFRKLREAEK